jgi:hypothetical protein
MDCIRTAEWLTKAPREVSNRPVPLWRVTFADSSQTALYLSPHTGELLAKRHNLWRWLAAKDVRAVLAALEGAIQGSVSQKGAGQFVLPDMLKITSAKVPAKPKRKGINPFTKEEIWFAAKPASTRLKVRPLKKLKDAAV